MSSETLTLDQWYIDYHEAMAAATKVRAAVRRHATIFQIASSLWSAARDVRRLIPEHERLLQHGARLLLLPDKLQDLLESLKKLCDTLDELFDVARAKGYTNRTLTSHSLHSIRDIGDELRDYYETLKLSLDPHTNQLIDEAIRESESSPTVSLDSLA